DDQSRTKSHRDPEDRQNNQDRGNQVSHKIDDGMADKIALPGDALNLDPSRKIRGQLGQSTVESEAQLHNADTWLIRDSKSDSRTATQAKKRHCRLLIIPPHFGNVTQTHQTSRLRLAGRAAAN